MNREVFINGNKTILDTDFYFYLLSCENENTNLKQALNEIKEFLKRYEDSDWIEVDCVREGVKEIIDKVGGNE